MSLISGTRICRFTRGPVSRVGGALCGRLAMGQSPALRQPSGHQKYEGAAQSREWFQFGQRIRSV